MPNRNDAVKKQPNWSKVRSEYCEWVDRIRVVPNKLLRLVLLASFVSLVLLRDSNHKWYFTVLLALFGISSISLIGREGHKEGYVDGYGEGYDQGRDDALGIDREMRHFLDQVEMDKEIQKDIQDSK